MANANLSFVSSLQRGLDAGLTRPDVIPTSLNEMRATVDVALEFDDSQISRTLLSLVGPGDIIGLDPRAIVRTYPRRDDNDAESEYFALLELDQADLPWRYTPAKPAGDVAANTDKLRPWLTLIVLVEGDELADEDLTPASLTQKLPLVSVRRKHLPTETDIWAWAHLQANETIETGAPLEDALAGEPGRVVARVISARILKKQKAYRAFLVPTFERGRRVITGETLDDVDALTPAWVRPPDDDVAAGEEKISLPVYHDWRFQTGTAGSFEALVSALEPRVLPDTVGRRMMDVHKPGLELLDPAPAPIWVAGALQSAAAARMVDTPPAQLWIDGLKAFVDTSEIRIGAQTIKVVAPPLYGRWYAAQSTLATPTWFFTLNSDPRHRVAAALGTEVVQREQQSLMEAAWRQIDQLRSVNYERKVLQVARQVFGRFMLRHISIGFLESQLALTGRLHGRILSGTDTTVFDRFGDSALGHDFFDPQWRRLVSPRGILGRRLGLPRLSGQAPNIFGRINDGTVELAPTPPPPIGANTPEAVWGPTVAGDLTEKEMTDLVNLLGKDGLIFWGLVVVWVGRKLLIDMNGQFWWLLHKLIRLGFALIRLANDLQLVRPKLREALRTDSLKPAQVTDAPAAPGFTIATDVSIFDPATIPPEPGLLPPANAVDSADAAQFREAAADLMAYLGRERAQPTFTKLDLPAVLKTVMDGIAPALTLVEGHKERLSFDSIGWRAQDPLEPILSAPEFDRPMYEPLRQISDEWILPGLGQVPQDTISLVVTNQRFVEAYMTGVNHEMTRELVWNEFPVDQRGTYFRQFWDARSFVSATDNNHGAEALKDINPIRSWPAASELGDHSPRPGVAEQDDPRVVLLVRGQLIKRYPNVVVYAATSATREEVPPDDYRERHPIFNGFLGGDVAYYAFDLKLSDVKDAADPWFFILQEQPAEPRFGVPETPPDDPPYARVAPEFNGAGTAANVAWDGFRDPLRVAVKGSALMSPPSP